MKCANCQAEGAPAYTLRAHVERGQPGGDEDDGGARTDGGAGATVDLPFCSLECLTAWT